jgi:hypothetical protein
MTGTPVAPSASGGFFSPIMPGGALAVRAGSLPAMLTYPSSIGPEDEAARQRQFRTIPGASTPLPSGAFTPAGQPTARLDGQAMIAVNVNLSGSDELMRLLSPNSSVQSIATGNLGTSEPGASPDQGGRNPSTGVSR